MKNNYILLIILFFCLISLSGFSQTSKKGFRFLEKNDIIKAKEAFEKELFDAKDDPGCNFGMALIYSSDQYTGKDIFQAWRFIKKANANVGNLSGDDAEIIKEYFYNTEVRKKSYPASKRFSIQDEMIENELVRYLREENNLDNVNKFLNEFKDFSRYENIIHIRNYLEFRKAEDANSLLAFEDFLRKFPEAAQVELAIEKRNKLAFLDAQKKNTKEALQAFIDKYPDAIDVAEAIRLRNKIEFEKVKAQNTFQGYEDFLKMYPNSLFVPKAKELQKSLLYSEAKKINTIEAYNRFIKMYPEGAQYIDIFNLKSIELGKKYMQQHPALASITEWARGFDFSEKNDVPGAIIPVAGEKYVLAGSVLQEDDPFYTDAWVLNLNSSGKMMWNKTVGESFTDMPTSIVQNIENDIIIGGFTNVMSDTVPGKAWLFKMSENGNKMWNRSLEMPEVNVIDINSKNEIIVGGYLPADSLGNNYVLYKLTPGAKKFWERHYTNVGVVHDLKVTENDEIIVAGNNWVWKLDTDGYIIWEKYLPETDRIYSMDIGNNGAIILAGQRNMAECLLVMLDGQGNELWQQNYGGGDVGYCQVSNAIVNHIGEIYLSLHINEAHKIVKANAFGEIVKEYDLNPTCTSKIVALEKSANGLIVLVSAFNLGQKEDMIVLKLRQF